MNVALNSLAVVSQYRSTMSMASVVDYDLVEDTRKVISCLTDGNNMSELDRYCLSVRNSSVAGCDEASDSDLMLLSLRANALKTYGQGLLKCMTQMKLYNSNGRLMYRFQSLVSSTILLEFIG